RHHLRLRRLRRHGRRGGPRRRGGARQRALAVPAGPAGLLRQRDGVPRLLLDRRASRAAPGRRAQPELPRRSRGGRGDHRRAHPVAAAALLGGGDRAGLGGGGGDLGGAQDRHGLPLPVL
ncbi:MAG: Putative phosphatidylglycerophosphate synthase, partial [uncultured Pseudonocardia sp.]